jgi:MFS family permease
MTSDSKRHLILPTKAAFLATRLLSIPFWVLFNLLPIILYKEMHITPWMITAMIVIKPASALFASYWSNWIYGRSDRLVSNLVWANILRFAPFLFLPWIDSPWLIMAMYGIYMMLYRGVIPAWMEIFKQNLEGSTRSRVFAYGTALDYVGTALLPVGMGLILDDYTQSWRLLFPISAAIGLTSTFFLWKLPSPAPFSKPQAPFSIKEHLLKPWTQALAIMKTRPDFAYFQWGFIVLGGAGLMVIQPALPVFFVDVLNLSYTKILLAMAACKAAGFALASPGWIRLFHSWNIYRFCGFVSLLGALFPLLVIASQSYPELIYAAYVLYGVMQAGSELSWNMSGPLFSKDQESSAYSMTNVLSVGVRGCFAPPVGNLLLMLGGSATALLAGTSLCLASSLYLIRSRYFELEPKATE